MMWEYLTVLQGLFPISVGPLAHLLSQHYGFPQAFLSTGGLGAKDL